MSLTKRKDGIYGYVELDNAPVNAINKSMRQGLLDAISWAEDEGLERVILSGKGRAFAAGADAREFDQAALDPHLPDVLARLAASPVAWIAAIHGPALGGGAEILLACRYRIARPGRLVSPSPQGRLVSPPSREPGWLVSPLPRHPAARPVPRWLSRRPESLATPGFQGSSCLDSRCRAWSMAHCRGETAWATQCRRWQGTSR